MPKASKIAFGFAEDGISLKLAIITREGNQVFIKNLEQVELDNPLYIHKPQVAVVDETDKQFGSGASADMNMDEFTAENIATYQVKPYEHLFRNNPLFQGVIALNVNKDNLIRLPINTSVLPPKQRNKLVRENLPIKDYRKGLWQSSVVAVNEQPELWLHRGENRLLEILEASRISTKANYYYQLADANETALASLFAYSLPATAEESSILLHLGVEFHHALVFKGNKWFASLPIQVTQHEPDIQTIYSKLSFALDEAHIADPQVLYVCGDLCNEDNLEYLKEQLPNSAVRMWELTGFDLDPEAATGFSPAQIVRYVLPIALAWKALLYDKTLPHLSNFLPGYIIEGQKVFKIAWHGFLTLGLMFALSLYLTVSYLGNSLKLTEAKSQYKSLQSEFGRKKARADAVLAMAKAIDAQAGIIEAIKTILVGKNPWNEILTTLTNDLKAHPISWLMNFKRAKDGFTIIGMTTERSNIVHFASLFPAAKIAKVTRHNIRNNTVWQFEIVYAFPVVNWYAMMEKDAQALKKMEESRALPGRETVVKPVSKANQPAESAKSGLGRELSKLKTSIVEKTEQLKQEKKETVIDRPIPPPELLSAADDPSVKDYKDFMTAFNKRQDWVMIDRGVKFINNYSPSPLISYVRWYLSYRAWQNKEYYRPLTWLEPMLKKPDAIYPYTLMLTGLIYRDSGDTQRGEDLWKSVLRDYPQHPVAKTVRELLKEKP